MKHISMAALSAALGASMAVQAAPMTVAIGQSQYFPALNKNIKIVNANAIIEYSNDINTTPGLNICDAINGMVYIYDVFQLDVTGNYKTKVQKKFATCDIETPEIFVTEEIKISSKPTSIGIDDTSGQITEFSGFEGGITSSTKPIYGYVTGGTHQARDLKVKIPEKTIYGSVIGKKYASGTKPESTFSTQNSSLWTFDTINGALALPINELQTSNNPAETIERNGFKVTATTSTEITFQGTYNISHLRLTTEGVNNYVKSLGLLTTGQSAFKTQSAAESGFGNLTVTVTFSMPLTP